MITLKDNERLVYAGQAALRAPDGTPLPTMPYYMIVSADEADRSCVIELKDNERLILGGKIGDIKSAKERYAAMKAGREQPPQTPDIPLYFIVDAKYVNPKTGLTYEQEKALLEAGKDLSGAIFRHIRKMKALERQGISTTEAHEGLPK